MKKLNFSPVQALLADHVPGRGRPIGYTRTPTQTAKIQGREWGPYGKPNQGRACLQAQLIGLSWIPNSLPYWAPNLRLVMERRCFPERLPNLCLAIRTTLGQRQIRQSPGLALNAHSGNEQDKIQVLTGDIRNLLGLSRPI